MSIKIDPRVQACASRIQDCCYDSEVSAAQDMQTTVDLIVREESEKILDKAKRLHHEWAADLSLYEKGSALWRRMNQWRKELADVFDLER